MKITNKEFKNGKEVRGVRGDLMRGVRRDLMTCLLFSIGLNGVKKMRGIRFFEKSSNPLAVWLPFSGQLSNHFIEGMRKIYELEPFISVEKNPNNQWGGVAVGI